MMNMKVKPPPCSIFAYSYCLLFSLVLSFDISRVQAATTEPSEGSLSLSLCALLFLVNHSNFIIFYLCFVVFYFIFMRCAWDPSDRIKSKIIILIKLIYFGKLVKWYHIIIAFLSNVSKYLVFNISKTYFVYFNNSLYNIFNKLYIFYHIIN